MKTGFIGLGHLGKTMAKRLIGEGIELVVWNRTPEKAADLKAEVAASPADLAAKADVIFMNLFDSEAVWSVISGTGGLLEADCSGRIIIDTSTNHFEDVLHFHEMLRETGASYLEAPVLGSVVPAQQGNLTVLVSGEKRPYEKVLPLLEKIGKTIFYLDKPSLATRMKLINNLVLGSFMATLAEAIALAEAAGIDKAGAIEMLLAGAGNSVVLTAKKEKILKEDFSTQFSSALIYKDLDYLQDLAFTLKRPLFTGSVVKELFGMTFSRDIEDQDFSAVYEVMKGL
ncbi:MAG: NAD(P)-dependent oxidoreductase [Nitrospirae bacterium]|nr:NAD(P)-dependent oxidoreductase [Nitrospirota bacterium]